MFGNELLNLCAIAKKVQFLIAQSYFELNNLESSELSDERDVTERTGIDSIDKLCKKLCCPFVYHRTYVTAITACLWKVVD